MSNENESEKINPTPDNPTEPSRGMEVGYYNGVVVVAFWDGDKREEYPMDPNTADTLSNRLRKAAKKARKPDAG